MPSPPLKFVTRAHDLRTAGVRDILRHAALNVLSLSRRWLDRAMDAPCVHILLLHHVFDDESVAFRQLLSHLGASYRFISYTEAACRISDGDIDGRYLAFSFDDGLHCCRRAGDILSEFGASACFFVCPAIVGETDSRRIAQFCRKRLQHAPVKFMSWDDAEYLIDAGHEIGGHTCNHVNLNAVSREKAIEEIFESRTAIQSRLGAAAHFAWPYGTFSHFHPELVEAVSKAGYKSCASGVRGAHSPDRSRSIPRDGSSSVASMKCLRRDSVVATWPLRHIEYFLARSARKSLHVGNSWPESWGSYIASHHPRSPTPCTSSSTPFPSDQAAA